MTEAPVAAPSPAPEAPPTSEVPEAPKGGFSPLQAVALLASRREKGGSETSHEKAPEKGPKIQNAAVEQPERAPAEDPAPKGEDAEAPDGEPPGETEANDEAEQPPIDPPRSWPAKDKEAFKVLPRETQLRLKEIDKVREDTIQKGLRDNAERERALAAKERAAEEARTQYEQRLPAVVQMLQDELTKEFSDIRTMDDVVRLAQRDPARHGRFQALVQRAEHNAREHQQVEARKQQEAEQWFQNFTAEEDRKFLEAAPEFADPKKGDQLRREAADLLTDKGFSAKEIEDLWSGRKPLIVRDARWQLIVRDAMRFRAAQRTLPAAKAATSQPTVKPGTPPSKGERQATTVTTIEQKLARTGKVQDAVELLRAKRRA